MTNRVTSIGSVDVPDFLEVGNIVKVQHWFGEIVDIAITDNQVIMVQVNSPKAIWRNQRPEWLVYEEGQIIEADTVSAIQSIELYKARVEVMLKYIEDMENKWWIRQSSDS